MKCGLIFRVTIIVVCLLFWLPGRSQSVISPEVGVEEHLDTLIPAGLTFTNEQNQQVKLGDLFTKPTILTLVYFDCPGLCSPLLDGVSEVVEKMGMELGKDYQIVTISFNYKDTPEKAIQKKNTFLKKHSKSHANAWFYLTGDSASINAVVNAVGFRSKKQGNDWIHPAVITIVSPKGKITRYLYGVTFLPFDVKMAIIEAGKEQSRPTINRLLQFCFSYDPEGRRYTLAVTKISATIIIFLALVLFITLLIRSNRKNRNKD
ncbi:MAG: SCO family protein [Bacteroidota bacterium]